MKKVTFQPRGATESVDVSLESARSAEDPYGIAWIADVAFSFDSMKTGASSGLVHIEGKIHHYHILPRDGGVDVWLDGATDRLEVIDRSRRRSGKAAAASPIDQIVAPMPGTVLKVSVAPGDAFEPHQPLVVLESMKMEMTLSAPNAGTVEAVHCDVGELVPLGSVLVTLDVAGADDAS